MGDRKPFAIPASPEDITVPWINDATGWDVEGVELCDIGTGVGLVSSVYRATLTGSGCPASVVVKFTASDPAASETATVLSLYRREHRFFELLADQAPIRVPACYAAALSDAGDEAVVVMEDFGSLRPVHQVDGMGAEDAGRSVEALADWHARWWRDVEGLTDQQVALALGNPMYPVMLPMLFADGWAKLRASATCDPPASLHEIGERFGELIPGLLQQLDQDPVTLLHGDFRADNIMFDADGTPAVIDFQITHTGSAAFDVAYFITQSIEPDVAHQHEAELLDRWRRRVIAAGVPESDLERFDEDYRAAALLCLVYPVIGARGADLDDPRQARLVNTMMSRMARAVETHAAAVS